MQGIVMLINKFPYDIVSPEIFKKSGDIINDPTNSFVIEFLSASFL